jgi:uncharacterized glyoxalase superfamily protein PhnB
MVKNPPEGMPRLTPYLYYNDLGAALEWLGKAFGFQERMRLPGEDGALMHAEMGMADCVVMMGLPSQEFETSSAQDLPRVNASLYVYVEDVDAHHAHASAAGAEPGELQDMFWGDRMYAVRDLEGHHWTFATAKNEPAPPPGS